MLSQPGYYSLIQYCPDRTSMETANVGVLLFCPGWNFLDARLTTSFTRIETFFNKHEIDRASLSATLESIKQRILKAKDDFKTKEDLQRFIETRANELILTPPRSMKVLEPEKELDALYRELFGRREKVRQEKQPVLPELDAIFRRPSLQQRARFDLSVTIPMLGQVVKVPYAYQNGTLNLVQPAIFSTLEGHAIHRAERLAIEGDLLSKHPDEQGNARRLIVVMKAAEPAGDAQVMHRISELLTAYNVRSILPEQLTQFAQEVETAAH